MRLLGRRGCGCRLCRPGGDLDERERKAVRDVEQHDVHVVLVSDAVPCTCEGHQEHDHEPSGEPDFAYTVGLWHQRRHPELLISGIPRMEVMHRALNELTARVVAGQVLRPGELYEDVLGGVPVTVEELTPEATQRMVTWSAWFHRRPVPALQVVWPDTSGVFAWQGAAAEVDERQPPAWRVAGPRTGALAPEPSWPFPVAPDRLVFTCTHVLEGEAPVLYAQRDSDPEDGEDWWVACDGEHPDDQLVMAHLRHAVARSPGVREVADLPLDSWARRADAQSPWTRFP